MIGKLTVLLSTIVKSILQEHEVPKHKLIVQTHDGASVMKGRLNGVAMIKEEFWFSHFVHCCAHQLNLIMQKLCSTTA